MRRTGSTRTFLHSVHLTAYNRMLQRIVLCCSICILSLLSITFNVSADTHRSDTHSAGSYSGIAEIPAYTAAIWQLPLQGAIGPASSDLLIRTIDQAEQHNVRLLIVALDTPGGLMTSMRKIIHRMLASNVPIAVYVSPRGARAASAGTYLLYASHLAAMAPATNLGAATPVQMGAPRRPLQPGNPDGSEQPAQPDGLSAMEKKVINDAVAHIRGLAALYGRNADWAEQAVREGASLDAEQALRHAVIEIVASDVDDLLRQADARIIQLKEQDIELQLQGLPLVTLQLDWRYEFLSTITNPNVAYILMMIGFYGLLLEFYNPGVGVPGVVGAISLLTALYALQLLPVSYAGLGLILLGLGLMAAEALSPSFGILGMGGLVAFVLGSILLMDTGIPEFQIALPIIAATAVISAVVCILLLTMALKSRRTPVASGIAMLVGQTALTLEPVHRGGRVRLNGEIWFARSQTPIAARQPVIVNRVEGLTLEVAPALLTARKEDR